MSFKLYGLNDLNPNSLVLRQMSDDNFAALDINRFFSCESTARVDQAAWTAAVLAGEVFPQPANEAPDTPNYPLHVDVDPAGSSGRFLYFTDTSTVVYDDGVADVPLNMLPVFDYLNIGTTVKAVDTGDLSAGLIGGNQVFWDASAGSLGFYSNDATLTTAIYAAGGMAVYGVGGLRAEIAATGIVALRDSSAVQRVVLDPTSSSAAVAVKNASAVTTTQLSQGGLEINPTSNATLAGLTVYSPATGSPSHVFRATTGSIPYQVGTDNADFTVQGANREVLGVNYSTNVLEVTGMLRGVPTSVGIVGDDLDVTGPVVVAAAQTGTEDVIATITAGTGVTLAAGMEILLRARTGDTLTVTGSGNIDATVPYVLTGNLNLRLHYDGSTWIVIGGSAMSRAVRKTMTANSAQTSTTPALLTGLTFNLLAGRKYRLSAQVLCSVDSATVGPRFLVAHSSVTSIRTEIRGTQGATVGPPSDTYINDALVSNDGTTSKTFTVPPTSTAGTVGIYEITTIIVVSGNGAMEIRGGVETVTGAPTATFYAGSTAELTILG